MIKMARKTTRKDETRAAEPERINTCRMFFFFFLFLLHVTYYVSSFFFVCRYFSTSVRTSIAQATSATSRQRRQHVSISVPKSRRGHIIATSTTPVVGVDTAVPTVREPPRPTAATSQQHYYLVTSY